MATEATRLTPSAVAVLELVLARGEVRSDELSRLGGISPAQATSAVGDLVRAGLTRVGKDGHGRLTVRVGETSALSGLLSQPLRGHSPEAVRLLRARQSLDQLIRRRRSSSGMERVTDLAEINRRIVELTASVTTEFFGVQSGPVPSDAMLETALPHDLSLLDRGVALRGVYPRSFATSPKLLEYARTLVAHGAQVRWADATPHRIIAVDGTRAVVPIDIHDTRSGALFLSDPVLVGGLVHLADALFRSSDDRLQTEATDAEPTPMERRVLILMSSGVTDDVAARRLQITDRQFRRYVAGLIRKLGASSRFQAGVRAVERGWL